METLTTTGTATRQLPFLVEIGQIALPTDVRLRSVAIDSKGRLAYLTYDDDVYYCGHRLYTYDLVRKEVSYVLFFDSRDRLYLTSDSWNHLDLVFDGTGSPEPFSEANFDRNRVQIQKEVIAAEQLLLTHPIRVFGIQYLYLFSQCDLATVKVVSYDDLITGNTNSCTEYTVRVRQSTIDKLVGRKFVYAAIRDHAIYLMFSRTDNDVDLLVVKLSPNSSGGGSSSGCWHEDTSVVLPLPGYLAEGLLVFDDMAVLPAETNKCWFHDDTVRSYKLAADNNNVGSNNNVGYGYGCDNVAHLMSLLPEELLRRETNISYYTNGTFYASFAIDYHDHHQHLHIYKARMYWPAKLFCLMLLVTDHELQVPQKTDINISDNNSSTNVVTPETHNVSHGGGSSSGSGGGGDTEVRRDNIRRFFNMTTQLPVELKMILCYRCVGSAKEYIRTQAWTSIIDIML